MITNNLKETQNDQKDTKKHKERKKPAEAQNRIKEHNDTPNTKISKSTLKKQKITRKCHKVLDTE